MTVTVVFGKASDGYVSSYSASYSTARNGPADSAVQGTAFYVGQNNNGGQYAAFEGFVGYDYPAIPTSDAVVAAEVRLYNVAILNTGLSQDIEWRGYSWSGSGLTAGDWRTPAQLAAARLDGSTRVTSAMKDKRIQASSDNLLNAMRPATSMEHVVVTSRMRSGTTPTSDEGYAFSSADEGGTVFDPTMVYTSTKRHTLFGVLGAQVKVSDGWCYIESNGSASPTLTLRHRSNGGTVTTIATLPLGADANQFSPPYGAQAFALAVGPGDQLFVVSRYGPTLNNLAIIGYTRGNGVTWTASIMRSAALPTYGATINNVAAVYHEVAGGVVMAIASHIGSNGDSVTHNELAHVVFSAPTVLQSNTNNTLYYQVKSSIPSLQPVESVPGYFNSWHNQTGTGLDIASPAQSNINGSHSWGYVYSFGMNANLGDNASLSEGRYVLSSSASSFTHASTKKLEGWGRKDAGAKVRVIPVSATAAAFISTDPDIGYGFTICVQNHNGTNAGSTEIGYVILSNEGIPSMPDGPALGSSAAWDAVYSAVENRIWIYYVSALNPREIRRTSFDLDTMQAAREEVLVRTTDVGNEITGIRVQRNAPILQNTLLTYSTVNGSTLSTFYYVDFYNAAPNPPSLFARANYDATSSAQFAWSFSDPNADTQSAYQLEISRVSDGVIVLDTGKVLSTQWSHTVAANTIANGADYRWRVKVWDSQDSASDFSNYGTFTTSAGGTVTITNPATDNPLGVITDDIPVTWSVAGTTQAAYRIQLYRGATLVSDTGWVASAVTTVTVAGMLSDQEHSIRVQVRNASAVVTNIAARLVTPSFSTPEKPTLTAQPDPEGGFVLLAVDNPSPGVPNLGVAEVGFENGIGSWVGNTNAATAAEAGIVHRGTGALRLTVNGALTQATARDNVNYVPVVAGGRYTARAWVYLSVAGTVGASIDWLNNGAYVSTSSSNIAVPATTWTLVSVTGTAPATANRAIYGPTIRNSPAVGTFMVADEVTFGVASDRPDVARNAILRRAAGTGDPYEVIGYADPDGTFRDYTATAAINYEYVARGEA